MDSSRVICFSGYKANERPISFEFEDKDKLVRRVLASWYEPGYLNFRVMADDGFVYILEHNEIDDTWTVRRSEK